jgi:hypothetical protein
VILIRNYTAFLYSCIGIGEYRKKLGDFRKKKQKVEVTRLYSYFSKKKQLKAKYLVLTNIAKYKRGRIHKKVRPHLY